MSYSATNSNTTSRKGAEKTAVATTIVDNSLYVAPSNSKRNTVVKSHHVITPGFIPYSTFIENMEVQDILVGHQNRDAVVKWQYMILEEWLEEFYAAPTNTKIANFIRDQYEEIGRDSYLRGKVTEAWLQYGDCSFMAKPKFRSDVHEFILNYEPLNLRIILNLFTDFIPIKRGLLLWFKGGIKVGDRFQVMKWTPFKIIM